MLNALKWLYAATAYLAVKGVVFLGLAAADTLPIPQMLVIGMALTWIVGAVMLLVITASVRRYQSAKAVPPTKRQLPAAPNVDSPLRPATTNPTASGSDIHTGSVQQPSGA